MTAVNNVTKTSENAKNEAVEEKENSSTLSESDIKALKAKALRLQAILDDDGGM